MGGPYFIGIDIGTQGTKVLAIDSLGNIAAKGEYAYDFEVPHTGWAEQDPLLWWNAVTVSLEQLWGQGVDREQINAIGVSGQMHSLVLLDEDKNELGNAILWNDVRTHKECDVIEEQIGRGKVLSITRNAVLPGFTAPKILWLKHHEPERYAKIQHIMLPKDYIVYKLSGAFSCDVSDASGTSLFDVAARNWSKEIIEALDIPFAWLPEVHESQTVVGHITKEAMAITGLNEGTPVIAGAGDNAAAALGNGIYQEGSGVVSVGTSGTVFAPLKELPPVDDDDEQLRTLHLFCHCLPNTWHAMGVTLSAGMSLNWFKRTFLAESYDTLLTGVEQEPAGSNGLLYLPYLNGERTPHNDPNATGVFFGMNYNHSRDSFTRAILEGVSYSIKECYDLIKRCHIKVDDLYVTGGASKSTSWRQILTDVLDKDLLVFDEREGPAFGAALLAGLGVGYWESPHDFPNCFEVSNKTVVNVENTEVYVKGFKTYKELYQHLAPLYSKVN